MKKTLLAAIIAMLGWSLLAADQTATDQQKQKLTRDQKQERKALIEKYDANKDGKLSKDELAKMSQEDKDKWASLKPKKQSHDKVKSSKKEHKNK
jgi:Ca2+-binding EF-hand superfamily protein